MNIAKYKIITKYGAVYETDRDGYVLTYTNGLDKRNSSSEELKTWRVLGLSKILPFNNLGPTICLEDACKIKDFRFKNGKPMYTLHDLDRGTHRVAGNWNTHGITKVIKLIDGRI